MAIRYVKDFEFPSAAGYTKSAPSKVTGPMFAKGGKVEKAPKGMMVVIGIGKPKGPVKKAEGGPLITGLAEDEGRYTEATRNARAQRQLKDFMDKAAEARWAASQARGSDWADKKNSADTADEQEAFARKYADNTSTETGYKHGGKVKSVPVKDIKSGKVKQSTDEDFYGKAKDMPMPPRRPAGMKKGGMKHDDAAQDKAMIKSMVKPAALKKAMGGPAVQMAKSNAIADSLKGQKKTPYAYGGPATGVMARPFGSGARQTDPSMSSTVPKKAGGVIKKADGGNVMPPRIASPLQAMAARSRGVPVAPRAPMIAPQAVPAMNQAAAPGGARIGVGRSRPGQPDVGAIRAAMARSASQAMPENAPSMMKKGGKVKC